MGRVLVTGMSGAGKSTLLAALAARGHRAVETDEDGWIGTGGEVDVARMSALLAAHPRVVVAVTADNQGELYPLVDHVVLLSAPLDVLLDRVRRRTTNPYGRTPEQQDEIRTYVRTVEPLLRRGATLELDGRRPVAELADVVEALLLADADGSGG